MPLQAKATGESAWLPYSSARQHSTRALMLHPHQVLPQAARCCDEDVTLQQHAISATCLHAAGYISTQCCQQGAPLHGALVYLKFTSSFPALLAASMSRAHWMAILPPYDSLKMCMGAFLNSGWPNSHSFMNTIRSDAISLLL